jgi:hypothetical protein
MMTRAFKSLSWSLLAIFCVSALPLAADELSKPAEGYVPGLGDMMAGVQLRHAKTWYAAKVGNWPLAAYELGQLDGNLLKARQLYPDLPPADAEPPTDRVAKAIEAKDEAGFTAAFELMTAACNRCHKAAGRGFIVIRAPTRFSPYSNQVFELPK